MRLFALIFLVYLPITVLGQTDAADTLTLNGIIFIGDSRKQIDSIELIPSNGPIISFSTNRSGRFLVKNLSEGGYRLYIKEFNYDTVINLKAGERKELWIFIPVACEVSEDVARLDIQQGNPRLLLIGGIAPSHVVCQEKFERKFHVKYYDFGCTPPGYACVLAYNKVIFNYLDSMYGAKWRKKVRTDVIGYN